MNSNRAFKISGATAADYTGNLVSNAGDINGDGFNDITNSTSIRRKYSKYGIEISF